MNAQKNDCSGPWANSAGIIILRQTAFFKTFAPFKCLFFFLLQLRNSSLYCAWRLLQISFTPPFRKNFHYKSRFDLNAPRKRYEQHQMTKSILIKMTNHIMLNMFSEAIACCIIWNINRNLTRELEILETFSQEHYPTSPACHKRSTPLPYTYQGRQGRQKSITD